MFPRIDKGPIEYYLDVYPAYSTEQRRECTRFRFRTAEEFSHFRYRISIEEKNEKGKLRFVLRGLKAKGLLPGTGVAESAVDLFDLSGKYDVTVVKPGDIVNTFRMSLDEHGPHLVKGVPDIDPFLEVHITNAYAEKE